MTVEERQFVSCVDLFLCHQTLFNFGLIIAVYYRGNALLNNKTVLLKSARHDVKQIYLL